MWGQGAVCTMAERVGLRYIPQWQAVGGGGSHKWSVRKYVAADHNLVICATLAVNDPHWV